MFISQELVDLLKKKIRLAEREAIGSYLRGHAEEAPSGDMRAALFWAAEHIESGDYMAQEEPPEKEEEK